MVNNIAALILSCLALLGVVTSISQGIYCAKKRMEYESDPLLSDTYKYRSHMCYMISVILSILSFMLSSNLSL